MSSVDDHDRIRGPREYGDFLAAYLQAHGLTHLRPWHRSTKPIRGFPRVLGRVEYLSAADRPLQRLHFAFQRVQLARAPVRLGVSGPPSVFGRGLSVAHYGSMVVNDRARVGKLFRIHAGSNIGVSGGQVPVIEDRVYIGSGGVVYGAARMGDDIAIGADALVGWDVPNGVTAAGVPARVSSGTGSVPVMPSWMTKVEAVPTPTGRSDP